MLERDRTRADHSTLTDNDTGADKGLGRHPGLRADRYRLGHKLKMGIIRVVGSTAKMGALRDDRISSELDPVHRVANDAGAENRMWPHLKIGWEPNGDRGVNPRSRVNVSAETAQ